MIRPPADVVFDTSLTDVFCFTDVTSKTGAALLPADGGIET